jgi:glycosyltransferase involved in cell wall biosynthesis
MAFFCILPVRDEGDIIEQSLNHLLTWADRIFILDTGSLDNTWEKIQEIALRDKRITLLGSNPVVFTNSITRGYMFEEARKEMSHGDWLVRVDADEFYHLPPPQFVKERMSRHETLAFRHYYDFVLTHQEVRNWENGQENLADRNRPIEDRRRWYFMHPYTEPRLCRYRENMKWPKNASFPKYAGYAARERIPIRHYSQRDPLQLNRRCRLRVAMNIYRDEKNISWESENWKNVLPPENDPILKYWVPGTDLPDYFNLSHLKPPHIRALQFAAHSMMLPILDRLGESFSQGLKPDPLSEAVQLKLFKECSREFNGDSGS